MCPSRPVLALSCVSLSELLSVALGVNDCWLNSAVNRLQLLCWLGEHDLMQYLACRCDERHLVTPPCKHDNGLEVFNFSSNRKLLS